jgi:hypothetical protein
MPGRLGGVEDELQPAANTNTSHRFANGWSVATLAATFSWGTPSSSAAAKPHKRLMAGDERSSQT